ncbi:3-hydroxyacyl-CoA dehydrogenase NAD-binding domain-containing protein [Psychroserpens sp.]|uniref:3-hydroxyacyl-CoA dehydrogenase NAD-binding domain-containing protein n=1 Tax=Psychroserpens sp. TaxID=2020870 RepID=UPI001B11100A|nr:3-hydroxyacyl-CoA dehydrogenase NAD-binding domain-containing protein [Psychroserpens sp.]MBO6607973.1 3-hydroxybutyryl-CoA dehydrogenase [Psychroserpens sp.]MBO6654900.1 3-hydroxybutyryl-CoA dehydrogenase [Psychroserpens sp.]MBO6683026.1 3-hydroxybutyryl-CoA dehydrogenase [Psychroserpens sp.]MBO6751331.1 3-hydroxybutyryl-CoA dehydrogenase [Psychroserpens sp.]MBO6916514.1 3-hydroxybutyryl-CoA dehydrogenase [Psychroserpens sp.]
MNVGIIGSGTMGSGIAQVAATAGCKVKLYDTNQAALDNAKAALEKILSRLIEKGRIDANEKERIQSNISYVDTLRDLSDSNLTIEAIIENLEIKQKVFKELETYVTDQCIIASNTSSLSIASIAASLEKPERCVGIHFFNPAPLMKLVEVIPAVQTSKEVLDTSVQTISDWKKVVAIAKDTPGFIVNRVARPFYGEALRIYEEGIADFATIDWSLKTLGGFRMGPFELMDFIGNDVNYTVTETVFTAFYFDPRYKPAFTQKRFAEAGYLGRKSGRGYYDYAEGAEKPIPNEDQELAQSIFDRVLVMLINEAADALFLNIASAEDIDNAMTKGVNYPKGLLSWADEKGIDWCVSQLDKLYDEYHEDRYRCSPLLRRMKKTQKTFF